MAAAGDVGAEVEQFLAQVAVVDGERGDDGGFAPWRVQLSKVRLSGARRMRAGTGPGWSPGTVVVNATGSRCWDRDSSMSGLEGGGAGEFRLDLGEHGGGAEGGGVLDSGARLDDLFGVAWSSSRRSRRRGVARWVVRWRWRADLETPYCAAISRRGVVRRARPMASRSGWVQMEQAGWWPGVGSGEMMAGPVAAAEDVEEDDIV